MTGLVWIAVGSVTALGAIVALCLAIPTGSDPDEAKEQQRALRDRLTKAAEEELNR